MKSSNGFLRYAQNTGYLLLEKIVRAIVTVTIWALVIRYLGPEQFGVFSYALSFSFLFNIFSDLGLDAIVVRELIKNKDSPNKILGTTFVLKLCGALLAVVFILVAIGTKLVDAYLGQLILIISLRMVFQSFGNIDYYFQSRVLSKCTVYSQLFGLLSTSILCLLLIKFQMPLIYFVYTVFVEAVIISIGLVLFYQASRQSVSLWQIDFNLAKKLLSDSWPLIVSGIAIAIYMRLDQIMIKEMAGVAAVGYYSAAVRVSEVFYFVPMILTSSLFPAIVNAKLKSEILYQNRLQALFAVLSLFALTAAVFITFLSPWLIKILYGPQYAPAVAVLVIHAWANVFVFWGVVRTRLLINENLQIYSAPYLIVAAVVNIILNLILIPAYSIKGAAMATVISQFIAAVLSNLFCRKTRYIFFLQMDSLNFLKVFKKSIIAQ